MARKKRTYEVVGGQPVIVDGVRRFPGTTFEASLVASEERFWVQTGAIRAAKEGKGK